MFRSKTLFVVGAGASKEVKIPIGEELAGKIIRLLHHKIDSNRLQDYDHRFFDCLKRSFGGGGAFYEYLPAAKQISEGLYLANSIDNYIDIHQHDPKISILGKASIIYTILEAEKNSSLYVDKMNFNEQIKFQKLAETWYVKFTKILFEQVTLDKLGDLFSNISIVCFNYDRCIQHFLTHAISSMYVIPIEEAQKFTESLKIYHPYGFIGNLFPGSPTQEIEFGKDTEGLNIVDLSKSIKTYTEQIEEDESLENLRQEVAEAETIVFLGFGFHPQNMNLLAPATKTKIRQVYATAFNISGPDTVAIKNQIYSTLSSAGIPGHFSIDRIQVRNNLTCEKLFTEYQRTLAIN